MSEQAVPIGVDATGYEVLTEAIKDLLNQFPGLMEDETVKFEEIGEESGIAFSNDSGALIYTETEDICDNVFQTCQYSFYIIYRAAASAKERQKMSISEFLDAFGKWLCKETAIIDGTEYKLKSYPTLANGRKITKITRSNSYGDEPYDNGVQDWYLPVTVYYRNEFSRWSKA